MTLKQVIEALVFASQKPLMPKEIVSALKSAAAEVEEARDFGKVKEPDVAALLEELKNEYVEAQRAFQLVEKVSGWQLVTDPACGLWVRQLYPESKPTRLSGPALETLAIIAYRQPITRADIEAVRGVAVDGVVQSLLERGLIRIAGRAEVPGRPLLYDTTQVFLEHFGLRELEELPNSNELRRINLPTAPAAPAKPEAPTQMTLNESKGAEVPATDPAEAQQSTPGEEQPVSEAAAEVTPEVAPETAEPSPDTALPEPTEPEQAKP